MNLRSVLLLAIFARSSCEARFLRALAPQEDEDEIIPVVYFPYESLGHARPRRKRGKTMLEKAQDDLEKGLAAIERAEAKEERMIEQDEKNGKK